MKDKYAEIFNDKQRILVILAHPDDCEIICGGLVARLVADGKDVRLISTTNGGKGMRDKGGITETEYAKLRQNQQIRGGKLLGVDTQNIYNLGVADGEYEPTLANIKQLVRHMREFQPQLVITHNPEEVINKFDENTYWVNHRDHRHTAQNVMDAAYPYCRDRGFFPEHFAEGLESCDVTEFLISDSYTHPAAVAFDISQFVEVKRHALQVHEGGIEAEEVDDFVEECRADDGHYYEVLRYIKTA